MTSVIGVGPEVAMVATKQLLDRWQPAHVMVVGVAGGTDAADQVGSLVLPKEVIDGDGDRRFAHVPIGDRAHSGALRTSSRLVVDAEQFSSLRNDGVVALDMETAAVASTCQERGVAWSVFRALSDKAGDFDETILTLLESDGSANLPAVARHLARRPAEMRRLIRLAKGASLACSAAARGAVAALTEL